jgi:DHA2 family multidrug resistance protein-like MFS transporter
MNETSGEFGFALGIATLGSIGTAIYRTQVSGAIPADVPTAAAGAARDTLAGATAAAANLPDPLASALLAPAREAFTSGMHAAATISAVLLAVVAILVVALLRQVRPSGEPANQETANQETANHETANQETANHETGADEAKDQAGRHECFVVASGG